MTFMWSFVTNKGAPIAISVIYGCLECNTLFVEQFMDFLRQVFLWDMFLSWPYLP